MRGLFGLVLLSAVLWLSVTAGGAIANGVAIAAPPNDNFANAIVLSGDVAVRTGDTNVNATLEAGEPTEVDGAPSGASVWYRWTAPATGQAKMNTADSDFDTLLAVYTGSAVGSLTEVAADDDSGGELTSFVSFAITSGTTYQIRVDGFEGDTGTINLHLHRVVPPANDDFANAVVLSGVSASRTGDTNEGATLEAGEPTTVDGVQAGASVWYRWTPADSGQLRIDTATSDFDTLLAIYTGNTVGTLSPVASNDNGKDGFTSTVTAAVTGGTIYRIRVDGQNGFTGTINLHLRETLPGPPPANDAFANAVVLSGQTASRSGDTNANATVEAGEPSTIAGAPGGASVWYQWTAPTNGAATIDTATSDFDTLLAVYTGTAVGTLSVVVGNDDSGDALTSKVTFQVTASTVYRIRVDGYTGAAGTVNLHLAEVLPPPNDNFANAIVLSGRSAARTADTNVAATLETGEPGTVAGEPAGASVWYRWTSPVTGAARVDAITNDFGTLVGIYTGTAVNALTVVAGDFGAATFAVTAGTIYQIRVDGDFSGTGPFDLHLITAPDPPAGVTATPGAGLATMSWIPPAVDGGSPITGYLVAVYVGNAQVGTVFSGVTSQVSVALTNGTTYTFRVAARNAAGVGALSAPSSPVTPRTVPGAPGNLAAIAGQEAATLTWNAPASNGGSPITDYVVQRFAGGVLTGSTSVGVVTQAVIGGLAAGVSHTFRVLAVNAAGAGPPSAESNPVIPLAVRLTLTVAKAGSGGGTVASDSGGISCGAVCTADFAAGSSVRLTATAATGSKFAGWTGACTGTGACTVTMDSPKNVLATFNKVAKPKPCVVPNVKRKTLAKAKRSIAAGQCRTGKVTKAKSKTVPKGRVVSQSPKAGKKLASGAKVNLVVSRGKR